MRMRFPFYVHGSRPILFAEREKVKRMLDEEVAKGIIAPGAEPKPRDGIRLCVDLKRLNKYVRRPTHPVRTPRDAVAEINGDAHSQCAGHRRRILSDTLEAIVPKFDHLHDPMG